MTDLGTLGGETSQGTAINAKGQVTGYADTAKAGSTHAFITRGATMIDLGSLGGTYSAGLAINASGEVVGAAYTAGNRTQHAFLYIKRKMIDLNEFLSSSDRSTYTLSEAVAINDQGDIVVNGVDSSTHGKQVFLLRPASGAP